MTHLRIVARGGYTPGAGSIVASEQWQFGIRLALETGGNPAGDIWTLGTGWTFNEGQQAYATSADWDIESNLSMRSGVHTFDGVEYLDQNAGPAFRDFWEGNTMLSSLCQLQELSIYAYNNTGDALPVGETSYKASLYFTRSVVGYQTGLMPLQTACAVSLGTARIGKKGRGRFYLPGIGTQTTENGGQWKESVRSALLTKADDLLERLNYLGPTSPMVIPIVTGVPYQTGARVTRVRVGDYPDTQRRRRNRITEGYSYSNIQP